LNRTKSARDGWQRNTKDDVTESLNGFAAFRKSRLSYPKGVCSSWSTSADWACRRTRYGATFCTKQASSSFMVQLMVLAEKVSYGYLLPQVAKRWNWVWSDFATDLLNSRTERGFMSELPLVFKDTA
jgi:hypothetical protein